MVFTIIDTPRTEIGDQTRMSGLNDVDLSTQQSIPSPSKDGNDLLKQIRGMRPAAARTPLVRAPFGDRRNLPSKAEFTPLLKSAARNNLHRAHGEVKENDRYLQTPLGPGRGFNGDSPALPFNSSVINEEHTGSDQHDADGPSLAAPMYSSSPVSTPIAPSRRSEGPLDARGNLATLREQEARLEQIDKENFSLKLKIHFMEEALRRNGKEFNEAAIKENTELKVDKVTLQRDLKHYRKQLAQAEKDLEDYRQQLKDYIEKVKRRHVSEGMQEELDQLRKSLVSKETEIRDLQRQVEASQDLQQQVDKLQDECGDLEAELREKDRELDEKDEQIGKLGERGSSEEDLSAQLREKERTLAERTQELEHLKERYEQEKDDSAQRKVEQQRMLDEKDQRIRQLEEQLTSSAGEAKELRGRLEHVDDSGSVLQGKDRDLASKQQEVDRLTAELDEVKRAAARSSDQDVQREPSSPVVDSNEAHPPNATPAQDHDLDKFTNQIDDLESALRQKERQLEEKEEEIDNLHEALQAEKRQADEDVQACEDRIQELETQQKQNFKELQSLRDSQSTASATRTEALESAQARIREIEQQQILEKEQETHLQEELNRLHDKLQRLQGIIADKDANLLSEQEHWASERKALEASKSRSHDHAAGLQRTLDGLQDAEGTHSGREAQLQLALKSEKERFETENVSLKNDLEEALQNSNAHWQSLQDLRTELRLSEDEVNKLQQQLHTSKTVQAGLEDKIQSLEDEIEVLQAGMDDDADRAKEDIATSRQEVVSLQNLLVGLKQDLARARSERDELEQATRRSSHLPSTVRAATPHKQSQDEVENLKAEITRVKSDRDAVQQRLREFETFDAAGSSGTGNKHSQRLRDLQNQLSEASREKNALKGDLAMTNADLDVLHSSVSELRNARDAAQQQLRDLRSQLQVAQREHDRKQQSLTFKYEQDVQNLEADLASASSKHDLLEGDRRTAEQSVGRMKATIIALESSLATLRSARSNSDTSVAERKDLHDMLKDAKLEAEDLALQVRDRETRMIAAAAKESELRTQLKRLRDERATQTNRADSTARELHVLQSAHDNLIAEMASARGSQSVGRMPKNSDAVTQKRHVAELRTLTTQIEYLAARCKREERFRQDLGYIKQYFTKQVEMHGAWTAADLKLVHAMGIPTNDVVAEEEVNLKLGVGRVASRRGDRPSLKCVGLMVLAGVRMQRQASRWQSAKKAHEGLVRKLKESQGLRRTKAVR